VTVPVTAPLQNVLSEPPFLSGTDETVCRNEIFFYVQSITYSQLIVCKSLIIGSRKSISDTLRSNPQNNIRGLLRLSLQCHSSSMSLFNVTPAFRMAGFFIRVSELCSTKARSIARCRGD
jgi:hypothetical protein